MNEFQIEVLRQVVGHCSHNIGWNGIHASSLDLLTEVLQKYLTEVGQSMHRYSEQFGRTEPNLDDLGLSFRDMGVTIQDLSDYVSNVEPTSFHEDISKIPVAREHNLNFLKPGSLEVLSRPVHIHEHLPPMQHIILGEEKISGDNQEVNESLGIAIQDNAELAHTSTLSPRSYPFKRPDGAEKRKGGWLDDEGQPIREISSVMMTTSGYLSSSREGKLPETKMRKIFLEAEVETGFVTEKKINIKKVFEGIKKADEGTKKCEEKEDQLKKSNDIQKDREVGIGEEKKLLQEHVKGDGEKEAKKERSKEKEREKEKEVEKEKFAEKEKEREKEKEKIKKKRNKEKLLEEFNFFEKDKPMTFKPAEPAAPIDTTKQKLNIFKKLSKTRDTADNHHSRASLATTRVVSDTPELSEKISTGTFETFGKGHSESPSPSVSSAASMNEKVKVSKKERKLKIKRDRHAFHSEVEGEIDEQHKRKPGKEIFPAEPVCSIEESLEPEEQTSFARSNQNKPKTASNHFVDQPKKKRGRPSRVLTPDQEAIQASEVVTPTHTESFIPSMPKPFFPFPPHFSVPGLIPPPFIPNVPFNLLGVPPLGLRSPLGIPPVNMSANAGPIVANASPPPGFYTPPKVDSLNKVPLLPSPNTKSSPNIVDSLPESADMPLNAASCEDDLNLEKKKEKRDKKDKEKKKKDKKIKEKVVDDQERKNKREKKKEKKDKEKDKEKTKDKDETLTVPKITFKFAAAPTSPAQPAIQDSTPKITFKAIAEREENFSTPSSASRDGISQSTSQPSIEVAKFSALITRPPKLVKPSKKEPLANKPCVEPTAETPSTSALPAPRTPSPSPKVRREKPQKPPRITKEKDKEKEKKKAEKSGDVAVITETVGSYYDEFGNKIWICPACGRQDDGTPMIGCDECDDWYHWVCVGIRVPPAETESWFCQRCIAKKQGSLKDKKKGRKKKSV